MPTRRMPPSLWSSACAASGVSQLPPMRRRNARSAATALATWSSCSARMAMSRVASSSARTSMPSTPCAHAGIESSSGGPAMRSRSLSAPRPMREERTASTARLFALVGLTACVHPTHSPNSAARAAVDDRVSGPERAAQAATDDDREAERAAARAYEAELIAAQQCGLARCNDESFDIRRFECRDLVPSYPVYWPNRHPIDFRCPDPPDAWNPACTSWMPCPAPPDRRVDACLRDKENRWAPCDVSRP